MRQLNRLLLFAVMLGAAPAVAQEEADSVEIYCPIDPHPELVGSLDSLNALVVYPKEALEAEVEGRVFLQMMVEPDGSVSEVEVFRGLGHGLDEEAVRVVEQARFRWPEDYPGEWSRRVRFSLPITFTLPGD